MPAFNLHSPYEMHVTVAAIMFAVGVLLGLIAGRFVAFFLTRVGFDQLASRTGLIDDLARVGIGLRPARLAGRLTFLVIAAAAFVQAVNALELTPISQSLGIFLTFLPHVVLAIVIVLVGVIVGDTVSRGAADAMSRSGVLFHDVARNVVRASIIVLAVLMALEQLTVAAGFLLYVLLVVLAAVGLAAGIAGGWGGRAFAENIAAGRYVESHLRVGDFIRLEGETGRIESLGAMSIVILTADERTVIFPNALLARCVVESSKVPLPPRL